MVVQIMRIQPLGINLDLPRHLVPPENWTRAQNMIFDAQRSRTSLGYTHATGAPNAVPRDLTYIRAGNTNYWFYMTTGGMGYWDGTNFVDLTPSGYSVTGDGFYVRAFNNVPIFCNRGDQPHYWDFAAAQALPLPGWPNASPTWRCDEIVPFRNFLFALKVQEDAAGFNNVKLRWSAAAPAGSVPSEWVPSATNQAGDAFLASPEGELVSALTLRDTLFIYKDNSSHIAQLVGGAFIFTVANNFEGIGLLAPRAVVELDNTHIMMTQDDIIRHDGVSIRTIATDRVRNAIYDDISSEYKNRAYLQVSRFNDSIYVFYPSKTSQGYCDKMFQYNFVTDTWGERVFLEETACAETGAFTDDVVENLTWDTWTAAPNTWDGLVGTWNYEDKSAARNRIIIGSAAPNFWKVGGTTDNGAAIPTLLEKTNIDLGKSERYKLIQRVWPNFEEGLGLTVNISVGAGDANGLPTWGPPQPFVIGQDQYVGGDVSGRAMALRIESTMAGQWAFSSAEVEFREQGRH